MFSVNKKSLKQSRKSLLGKNIRWVVGGSCSGKTTLCKTLSKEKGVSLYDMDEHIFGKYMPRYSPEKHPANTAWFFRDNSLEWVLSLSLKEFCELNQAANAEYLELFSEDMDKCKNDKVALVDGGITYPSLLAKVIPPENIICLKVSLKESRLIWETAKSKKEMKSMISKLPNPDKLWKKFLKLNDITTNEILKGSAKNGIKIMSRDSTSPSELSKWLLSSQEKCK